MRCTVLHGTKDQMVSGVHPEYFAKQIPDARLHVFPEGKHNIHLKREKCAFFLKPLARQSGVPLFFCMKGTNYFKH